MPDFDTVVMAPAPTVGGGAVAGVPVGSDRVRPPHAGLDASGAGLGGSGAGLDASSAGLGGSGAGLDASGAGLEGSSAGLGASGASLESGRAGRRDSSFEPGGSGRGASISSGAALFDLLTGGVEVAGRRVRLDDLRPASSFARGAWSRAGGDASTVFFGEGELVRGFVTVVDEGPVDGGREAAVVLGVRGERPAPGLVPGRRVHLVIDASESMAGVWGEVRAAVGGLLEALSPADIIHVVVYGATARVALSPTPVGDGRAVLAALGRVEVGGHTNIEAGLRLAYEEVRRGGASTASAARDEIVILISDGVPNVGAFGPTAMGAVAGQARAELGCTTAVVGLGSGFDAAVLRAVSTEGRGGYHAAPTAAALLPALISELAGDEALVARDLSWELRLGPGVEVVEVIDGAAGVRIDGGRVSFEAPVLHEGEERQVVVRLRWSSAGPASSPGRLVLTHRGLADVGGAVDVPLPAPGPVSSVIARAALEDAEISRALARASIAVRDADGAGAALALRACRARLVAGPRGRGAPLDFRRAVLIGDLATALDALVADASGADRRLVARALGSLSVRFGR